MPITHFTQKQMVRLKADLNQMREVIPQVGRFTEFGKEAGHRLCMLAKRFPV